MAAAPDDDAQPAEADPDGKEPGSGADDEKAARAAEEPSRAAAKSPEAPDESPLSPQEQRAEDAIVRTLRARGRSALGATVSFGGPSSFGGHAAGRDVINYYWTSERGRRPRVGRVSQDELAELRLVYVSGQADAQLLAVLHQRRLVILRGEESSGRRAAALHALAGLVADRISCIAAGEEGDPLGDCDLLEKTGHIVELRSRAKELSQVTNDHLAERLASLQSYLVVLVPVDAAWSDRAVARHLVDHRRPDGRTVFERHLSGIHRLGEPRVSDLAAWAEDAARLHTASPGWIADLAEDVVGVAERGTSPSEALESRLRRQAVALLRGLDAGDTELSGSERLHRRALLLALAVFDGLPCTSVEVAAEPLYLVLRDIEYPQWPPGRRAFGALRADWLGEFDATLERREALSRRSEVPVPCATMRCSGLGKMVLTEAWWQYEAARSAILGWLHDLGAHPAPEIRVRVAQTVGWLAAHDLDPVYHRVIAPWASSDRARQREAAAWALEAAEYTDGTRLSLVELVAEWAESGGVNRRRTATLCYGTAVFRGQPGKALRQLRMLARRSGDDEVSQVSRSVADLFAVGHCGEVVAEMRRWLADPDENLARVGAESVVQIAYLSDPDEGSPSLLVFAHSAAAAGQARVAALWHGALTDRAHRRDAWSALHTWFLQTDQRPELLPTLENVINDIIRMDPEIAPRVRWYLQYWLVHPTKGSSAAGKVQLAEVEEGGHERSA
jgi:hypothetical protein